MLSRLELRNFKAHRDTVLALAPLTLLVGPNASGKTSVLQAIHYLSQLVRKPVHELFVGDRAPELLLRRGADGAMRIRADGMDGAHASFSLKLAEPDDSESPAWTASFALSSPKPVMSGGHESRSLNAADSPETRAAWIQKGSFALYRGIPFLHELGSSVSFRLDARRVAAPGNSKKEVPRVEFDGGNTAAALAALKLADDNRFAAIVDSLRALVPTVRRVRLRPAPMTLDGVEVGGQQIFFDFEHADDLPASAASEGTLLTLALLTALHSPIRPRLVLLDDVEQALHPLAQIAFMRQVVRLVEGSGGELQVIATTHSPYVLDAVSMEQVVVLQPRPDGSVASKLLSEHPAAAAASGTLSAGQVWSLDPESWIFQGEPGAP